MTTDGTTIEGTAEAEGSEENPTPEPQPSQQVDEIALARKRQAGAEAARQQAEKARDAALAELEGYRQKAGAADDSNLKERLEFEKRRADEAEARANARILDTFYPNARKELPEVTDEVRLAKFEALLREDPEAEPPAPQNPNESNRVAKGDATARQPKEESSEDIIARLKVQGVPEGWL